MMREEKVYICDICGRRYGDSGDCKECEKSHIFPREINGFLFNIVSFSSTYDLDGFVYPHAISVKMRNGEIVEYVFEKVIQHETD